MAKIPMKLRVDLRDHWENVDCAAQKSITALRDLIGLPTSIKLDAHILWAELGRHYQDQAIFIPSIAGIVAAWCDALAERLQDDANAEWTEEFLEVLNDSGRSLKATVQAKLDTKVSTSLAKPTFMINIPQMTPPYRGASGYFAADFQKLFPKAPAMGKSHEDEDWASICLPSRAQQPHLPSANAAAAAASTDLPTPDSLSRPELLFASQTPYHLMVKIVRHGIHVYCSHQGSLELLSNYLTKYARNIDNQNVRLPIVRTKLEASHWGYGSLYDCLSITPGDARGTTNWEDINPVLILAFAEGVLGYRPVGNESGGNGGTQWYFKRDVGFRH